MKNYFVAFFDILGFKNLVEKNSHEELMDIYKVCLYENLNMNENISDSIFNRFTPAKEKTSSEIRTFVISDSIILVQNDMTQRGFLNLIAKCQVILSSSLAEGIPLRGALSYGPVTIIENQRGTTIVGRGLTKAYSLESAQQWSGGVIDKECFGLFPEINSDEFIQNLIGNLKNPLILKYYIPLKENKFISGYGFNWPQYNLLKDENEVVSSFTKHKKEISTEKEKLMIKNTVKYFLHGRNLLKIND